MGDANQAAPSSAPAGAVASTDPSDWRAAHDLLSRLCTSVEALKQQGERHAALLESLTAAAPTKAAAPPPVDVSALARSAATKAGRLPLMQAAPRNAPTATTPDAGAAEPAGAPAATPRTPQLSRLPSSRKKWGTASRGLGGAYAAGNEAGAAPKTVDALSEKEVARLLHPHRYSISELTFRRGVINPDGRVRIGWDVCMAVVVVYLSLAVPIELGFAPPLSLGARAFNVLLDFLFILDIIFNFFTGFFERKRYVADRRRIARRYLGSWFVPDVL
jgi:hypothetical protein